MENPATDASDARHTIAALSTAVGPAALSVVRISGGEAFAAARRILMGLPASPTPRQLLKATVLSDGGEPLDEVLAVFFPAPASYTGEDVVEIHGHGGLAVAAALEQRCVAACDRRARGGEFTKRAVANGKLDLLDAEALAALLSADDAQGLTAALSLRTACQQLRDLKRRLRNALVEAQGAADNPLDPRGREPNWRPLASALSTEIGALLDRGALDHSLRDGVSVAILGPANAGKSSLLNALVGEARALVDEEPGTTRDAVYAPLLLSGHRLTLIDTAGLREARGLERRGIEKAIEVGKQSDVRLWVEDVSAEPAEPPAGFTPDLRVLAKSDLAPHPSRTASGLDALQVSAQTGAGLEPLRALLRERLAARPGGLTARQRRELGAAHVALEALPGLDDDLAADRLRVADEALARLTGERPALVSAEEIYAQFCVGK